MFRVYGPTGHVKPQPTQVRIPARELDPISMFELSDSHTGALRYRNGPRNMFSKSLIIIKLSPTQVRLNLHFEKLAFTVGCLCLLLGVYQNSVFCLVFTTVHHNAHCYASNFHIVTSPFYSHNLASSQTVSNTSDGFIEVHWYIRYQRLAQNPCSNEIAVYGQTFIYRM